MMAVPAPASVDPSRPPGHLGQAPSGVRGVLPFRAPIQSIGFWKRGGGVMDLSQNAGAPEVEALDKLESVLEVLGGAEVLIGQALKR